MSSASNSSSSSSVNAMQKLLEKSKKLPKRIKEIIEKNYDGSWDAGDGYLYIDGYFAQSENEKLTDEMIPELLQCIELYVDRVKSLNIQNNKIKSKGVILLLDGLKQMKSRISGIYFGNNELDDECMKSLGEFIQYSKVIEAIDVGSNKITDKGIKILSPFLEGYTTLKTLNISVNYQITDKSVPYLIDIIKKSAITSLDTQDTSISNENKGEVDIFVAINKIKGGCYEINLSNSFVTDKGVEILCPHLEGNTTMKKLHLYGDIGITDKSVSYLIDIVKKSEVTSIDTKGTSISNEKQEEINILVAIKNIKSGCDKIDLNYGFVTDKGIEILYPHLEGNTILKKFYLFGNYKITDKSVPNLINAVKKSAITYMNLDDTSISEEKQREIDNQMKIPIDEREIAIKSLSKSAAKIL